MKIENKFLTKVLTHTKFVDDINYCLNNSMETEANVFIHDNRLSSVNEKGTEVKAFSWASPQKTRVGCGININLPYTLDNVKLPSMLKTKIGFYFDILFGDGGYGGYLGYENNVSLKTEYGDIGISIFDPKRIRQSEYVSIKHGLTSPKKNFVDAKKYQGIIRDCEVYSSVNMLDYKCVRSSDIIERCESLGHTITENFYDNIVRISPSLTLIKTGNILLYDEERKRWNEYRVDGEGLEMVIVYALDEYDSNDMNIKDDVIPLLGMADINGKTHSFLVDMHSICKAYNLKHFEMGLNSNDKLNRQFADELKNVACYDEDYVEEKFITNLTFVQNEGKINKSNIATLSKSINLNHRKVKRYMEETPTSLLWSNLYLVKSLFRQNGIAYDNL